MVNQKLVDYIKKHKSRGFSEDQIKDVLIKYGHSAKHVKEAIKAASRKKEKPAEAPTGIAVIKKRNPFLVFLFSFITAGIYYIYWLVSTTKELRKNTESAPNPWLIILFFVPFVNIIVALIYYWKYSKAINELTGFSKAALFILWIIFWPAAIILSQIELNKKS